MSAREHIVRKKAKRENVHKRAYCQEEGEEGNERDPVVSMLPG
jgi:hypothetical protein